MRIAAACEELFAADGAGARRPDGDVVVVSHVTPIKAAVAWALGTADLYWRLHLRTASVTRIGWNRDAPILHGFNEVALAPRQRRSATITRCLSPRRRSPRSGPTPGSGEDPVHRRTIAMEVFDRGEYFAVVGTLHDERPWAGGTHGPRDLHFMELGIVVRRADMAIVDAAADMRTYPHAECTDIEASFRDLIGLSVARGYTSAVQERFGRQRGCSHLEFLARAIGPVVVQGVTSSAAWQAEKGDGDAPDGRARLQLPGQHLPRLDRGRTGRAEDRHGLAAGPARVPGAPGGRDPAAAGGGAGARPEADAGPLRLPAR